jgi:hypothetical protein
MLVTLHGCTGLVAADVEDVLVALTMETYSAEGQPQRQVWPLQLKSR